QFVYAALQCCACHSAKASKKEQRFRAGEIFVEIRVLREKTNCFAAFDEATVSSKNFGVAACRRHQAENNLQCGALAGAVRPEQSVHFARFDAEVEVLYRDNPASGMERNRKNFGQSVNSDGRISHGESQSRAQRPVRSTCSRFVRE